MSFNPLVPEVGHEAAYQAPLAYALPYSWGALYVTAAAEASYGLSPIIPETREGLTTFADRRDAELPIDAGRHAVHILLCAQSEYPVTDDPNATVVEGIPCKDAIELVTTSGATMDSTDITIAMELAEIADSQDMEPEQLTLPNPEGGAEIPYDVLRALYATHAMTGRLDHAMSNVAGKFLHDTWRAEHGSHLLRRMRKLGLIGLGGALAADVGTTLLTNGELSHVVGITALVGVTAVRAYSILKIHFDTANIRERTWQMQQRNMQEVIAGDLHRSFCGENLAFPGSED